MFALIEKEAAFRIKISKSESQDQGQAEGCSQGWMDLFMDKMIGDDTCMPKPDCWVRLCGFRSSPRMVVV